MRPLTRSLVLALLAVASGCVTQLGAEGGAGVEHEQAAIVTIEGTELTDALRYESAREAPEPFGALGVIVDGTSAAEPGAPEGATDLEGAARAGIELATSADGVTWSAWLRPEVDVAAEDELEAIEREAGWVELPEGEASPAHFFKLRAVGGASPTSVSLELVAPGEVTDDALSSEDDAAPIGPEAIGDGLSLTAAGLSDFRRFRFDLGKVTKPWLWLLRTARRHGWRGSLYGSRTGLRTYAQQNALYQAYIHGRGAPAFPPWGPSRHLIRNVRRLGTWAQAVDTNDVGRLIDIARRYGVRLHRPYGGEPWHVEAARRFRAPRGWTSAMRGS